MKIKKVETNNRKKCFEVYTLKQTFEFPFSKVAGCNLAQESIQSVFVDRELGSEAFTFVLESKKEVTIHVDQVLEYGEDPDYLRKMLLFKMTVQALELIKKKRVSKRQIMRRMQTSPTQFYRLIDTSYYGKTIDQMVKLLSALDCPVDLVFDKAA